jgi:predicted N-acetyltransferase YhbS
VSIQIDHLFRHPTHIRLVAGWIYDAFWQGRAGYSVDTFDTLLRRANNPDRIPLSLLALVDGQPAGTVNLISNDDPQRPHLCPWLAALFVPIRYRHRGVGTQLVRVLLWEAGRLGLPELFLETDIPRFYARLGAEHYEQKAKGLFIMRFPLPEGRPAP